MSDSFLPPVTVEFAGNATAGLAAIAKMTKGFADLAKAAKACVDATTSAFSALEKGGAVLEALVGKADAAKVSIRGVASAERALGKAAATAATATDTGMASISAATERMAGSVSAATATARTGIAGIRTEAVATTAGLRTTAARSTEAGAAMAESGKKAEGMGMKLLGLGPIFDKVKKWGALGLAGIGIVAVDLGAKFQAAMTKLSTAAGAPIVQVNAMKSAVISAGQSVGMTGTEMATALYHPVSAGLSLSASLQAVKYAAEEAQISGASLEDTTYGLSSVMKSFNLSGSQAQATMAQLNAIVGEGDMRFQDLNGSVKNWVPTAATFGVSLSSAGAALDYFTDRGDTASTAGTKLSLIMTQMAGPSKQAATIYKALGLTQGEVTAKTKTLADTLSKAGVTQTKLAADLKQPDGIVVALTDLKSHLEASGMSAGEANAALVRAFGGGKQFKGVAELIQNIDGVKQKYDKITEDSTPAKFQAAWAKTTQTLSFQWAQIKSGAENLGIRLGTALIPQVSRLLNLLENKGAPVVSAFSSALSGIASGFSGAPAAPVVPVKGPTPRIGAGSPFAPAAPAAAVPAAPKLTGWQQAGKILASVVGDLKRTVSEIGTSFSNLYQAVQPALAFLGGAGLVALQAVAGILANVLGPALVAVTGFLAQHKTLVEGVVVGYVAYRGALVAMTVVTKGVELATKAAAAAQVLWNAALNANPIGAAIVVIGALALAAMYCWQHFQGFRNVVMDVFTGTGTFVAHAITGMIGFLKALADATLTSVSVLLGALGHLPGFGWAKSAAKDVEGFKATVDRSMDSVTNTINKTVAWAQQQRIDVVIRGNIDSLQKKIKDAKNQVADKNLPASKQIQLFADITNWQSQVALAKASMESTPEKKTAILTAEVSDWMAQIAAAKKQLASAPPGKKAVLTADIANLTSHLRTAQAQIDSLHGKTVTIMQQFQVSGTQLAPVGVRAPNAQANGGIVIPGLRTAATGLMTRQAGFASRPILWAEAGPEAYIPLDRAKQTRSRQIAEKTVGILGGQTTWGGKGGSGAAGAAASFAAMGAAIPAGLASGVSGASGAAHAAVVALAKATVDAFSQELGIQSPSKKFRSLGAYVIYGLVQGLTGSTASVKAATKRIATYLYTDFGSGHKALQATVARDNRALLSLAARRDAVATRLKAANANLASLQKQWAAEQKQVADSIMQSSTVVMDASTNGGWLDAAQVVTNFQQQTQKALQFAGFLRQAQANGLNAAMISQIAASGVDAGYATAQALASANKSQIAQLNQMQGNMQTAANGVGSSVADSMYGAGIKAAQGLVKGLQSQQAAIERQMLAIAKSMQAAIKRALGIKSPSRVFADLGQYIPKGLAVGIRENTHHATGAVMSMSSAVAGAGSRQLAYAGSGRGGGGTTVINNYKVEVIVQGNAVTERNLIDAVQAGLLKKGARNSQTYQQYKR